MATVKLQNGKVILKDGKVSCSCCGGPPGGCCMYPAQALADGDYAASDLPNTVTIGGVGYSLSGTSYGNTTNGVIFEGTVWAKYTNGARSSRPCLIQGGVEDQFADTYTVSGTYQGNPVSQIVTRFSLCVWIGEGWDIPPAPPQESNVTVFYFDPGEYADTFPDVSPDDYYKWAILEGAADNPVNFKSGNQNSPVGTYGGYTVS